MISAKETFIKTYDHFPCSVEKKTEWNQLVRESVSPNIFQTWEYSYVWWRNFGKGKQLKIAFIYDIEGLIIGIIPAWEGPISVLKGTEIPVYGSIKDSGPKIPGIRTSGFGMLGDGGPVCPEYIGPIVKNNISSKQRITIIEAIFKLSKKWQVLRISDLLDSIGFEDYLKKKLKYSYYSSNGEACLYHSLPESYENFLQNFKKKKRYNIKRTLKLAEKDFDVEMSTVNTINELNIAFNDLKKIYRNSERGQYGNSCWNSQDYFDFNKELAKKLLANRWLRMHILKFNGKPVAFSFCFFYLGTISFYQTAFESSYRKYSPGSILLQLTIKDAIEQGAMKFDYLRGDESYKFQFANDYNSQKNIVIFKKPGINNFSFLLKEKVSKLKETLKTRLY